MLCGYRPDSRANHVRKVILHVHRNPMTGVWSMMKHLVREQNRRPGVLAVLGVPADRDWIASAHMAEMQELEVPFLFARVPRMFGTAAYYWSMAHNPLRRWIRALRRQFPEASLMVHSHSAWLTGGYLPLPEVGRSALVASFHGIADDHRLRNTWWLGKAHRHLARRLVRSRIMLSAVSRDTAIRAEELLGIPESSFTVIPNGIPAPNFSTRRKLWPKAELLVGHVGQMHPGKGWHLLLEAVELLREQGHDVRLVLAGKGVDAERAARAASSRKKYVRYLGPVSNAGERLIPQLDALVLATWSEGMPMSIIEAFAAGVPVLATPVGGIPEMVEHGRNGLQIEREAASIAAALRQLLEDPVFAGRLQSGALETFRQRFEITRTLELYDRLYDDALEATCDGKQG